MLTCADLDDDADLTNLFLACSVQPTDDCADIADDADEPTWWDHLIDGPVM